MPNVRFCRGPRADLSPLAESSYRAHIPAKQGLALLRCTQGRLTKSLAWISGLVVLFFLLILLEAGGGHDGWLCEWGYDMDGDDLISGCG